jgi:hypothetical protein
MASSQTLLLLQTIRPLCPDATSPADEQAPPAVWAAAGKARKRRRSAARRGVASLGLGVGLLLKRNDVEGVAGGTGAMDRSGGERSEVMRRSVG